MVHVPRRNTLYPEDIKCVAHQLGVTKAQAFAVVQAFLRMIREMPTTECAMLPGLAVFEWKWSRGKWRMKARISRSLVRDPVGVGEGGER